MYSLEDEVDEIDVFFCVITDTVALMTSIFHCSKLCPLQTFWMIKEFPMCQLH